MGNKDRNKWSASLVDKFTKLILHLPFRSHKTESCVPQSMTFLRISWQYALNCPEDKQPKLMFAISSSPYLEENPLSGHDTHPPLLCFFHLRLFLSGPFPSLYCSHLAAEGVGVGVAEGCVGDLDADLPRLDRWQCNSGRRNRSADESEEKLPLNISNIDLCMEGCSRCGSQF